MYAIIITHGPPHMSDTASFHIWSRWSRFMHMIIVEEEDESWWWLLVRVCACGDVQHGRVELWRLAHLFGVLLVTCSMPLGYTPAAPSLADRGCWLMCAAA